MKKIIGLAAFVAVVVLAYGGAWLWAAGQAEAYVKTLETADGVTAPRVTCGVFGVGGFPFGFDITCNDATLVMNDITVTVAGLKAAAEVYNPTHVIVFAHAPIGIADAFTGIENRLDFEALEASVRLSGWRIGRVSAVVTAPVWSETILDDRLLARADRAELHFADVPARHDAEAGVATLLHYARIDNLVAPGFDVAAGQLTVESELSNVPDDVRTYGDADLLKRWQAAGGRLTLTRLEGVDGANRLVATGDLGLDSAGRVEGQMKFDSTGVVERFAPAVPEQYRGLIFGTPAADGSYSQTFNIAAGVVFSGLVATGMIPPLF
jgi:hypothetical protein